MKYALVIIMLTCTLLSGETLAMSTIEETNTPPLNGLYLTERENGAIIPLKDGEACPPPATMQDGTCIESFTSTNNLAMFEQENGAILFAVNAFFFNGHSCNIGGAAMPAGPDRWLYTIMDEIDMTDQSYDDCKLSIIRDETGFSLETDANAPCQMYCGMRGDLGGLRFDFTGKANRSISANRVKCLGFIDGAQDCNQYTQTPKEQ